MAHAAMTDKIERYNALAEALSAQYEALDPAALLGPVLDLVPYGASRLALDVGAAEASKGMLAVGMATYPKLRWIDDRLPSLQGEVSA